jgi:predicted phage terminase large subunit-like protein
MTKCNTIRSHEFVCPDAPVSGIYSCIVEGLRRAALRGGDLGGHHCIQGGMTLGQFANRVLTPLGQTPAPHHALLLDRLQAVADGGCDRLMVLMPPGSAKSTYASVIFPAWWLMRHPRANVVAACHTESLAAHFGRRVRAVLVEHGGDDPGLARDDRAAGRFATTAGGNYFATGVRGPLMGRRADLIVIDDPIKSQAEADSGATRDALWDWFRADLTTRLTPSGRIVLVMTRWHEDDLAGRLLAAGDGWQTLCLPAIAGADDPFRPPGAALWPEWENEAALARKRQAVGPRAWSALYQQSPRREAEALFQIGRIGVLDAAPACRREVRAWDLAATAADSGRDPDWTAGLKLGRAESGGLVVLDVQRLRGGPMEVAERIVQTARLDGRSVAVGLPQDPGQAGKQQVAWLTGLLAGFRVVSSPEVGSKLARAEVVAAQVEAGALATVRAGWTRALLDELRDFPGGRKDDQVDALARALAMLADAPARRLRVEVMGR